MSHFDLLQLPQEIIEYEIFFKYLSPYLVWIAPTCKKFLEIYKKWMFNEQKKTKKSKKLILIECMKLFMIDMKNMNQLNSYFERYIIKQNLNFSQKDRIDVLYRFGTVEIFDLLTERKFFDPYFEPNICKILEIGNLELVQWMERKYKWDENLYLCDILHERVLSGDLDVIKYLAPKSKHKWHPFFSHGAAEKGYLSMLEWIYTQNNLSEPAIGPACYFYAAKGGHIEILKWLHSILPEKNFDPNFRKSPDFLVPIKGVLSRADSFQGIACASAAKGNNLAALKYLVLELNFEITPSATLYAVKNKNLEMLKWILERKIPFHSDCIYYFAQWGDVDLFEWAIEQGCIWRNDCLKYAIQSGNIQIMDYIFDHFKSILWNSDYYFYAAETGNIYILEWIKTKNPSLPINKQSASVASSKGYIQIMDWLKKNNCIFGKTLYHSAINNSQFESIKWLRSQKPPVVWDSSIKDRIKATFSETEYKQLFNE